MSKLIGLTIIRNEAWICGYSLRIALQWVDEIVVLDHHSTDHTPQIISEINDEYPGRIHRLESQDPIWHEMEHRQATLAKGREIGGTHFAIIDADEVVTANLMQMARERIFELRPYQIFNLPMIPMWRSPYQFRNDKSIWSRATLSLAFADGQGVTWKPQADGYQFHNRVPSGIRPMRSRRRPADPLNGGVMHMQWVDFYRMQVKHILYQMRETIYHPGRKSPAELARLYSMASDETDLTVTPVPGEWIAEHHRFRKHLHLNERPWHCDEIERLIAEHGREKFQGLNFFGLIE